MDKMADLLRHNRALIESGRYREVSTGIDLPNNRFILKEVYVDGSEHVSYQAIF